MNQDQPATEIRDGYIWKDQYCPICGNLPTRFVGKRGGRSHRAALGVECDIWKCEHCDLVFPHPMPIPEGGLAQHYNVDADEYFQAHDQHDRLKGANSLIDSAEQLLGRKGKLLDVGVGRGEVLVAASERGWQCEGVEPSETFADHAAKLTGAPIWREPIECSEIPSDEFDVVILAAVLEHLYNPDEVLDKISRILKPGGFLYLDVPNEAGLYFKIGNAYQLIRRRDWCVIWLRPSHRSTSLDSARRHSGRSLRNMILNRGAGRYIRVRVWSPAGVASSAASKVLPRVS